MSTGWIFDIKRFAVHDGPGIRTTVFMKGCPLKCTWCHNPESQSPEPVIIKRERKIDGRSYFEEETIGRKISDAELLMELDKDRMFYSESSGGVTFSGGEPLMQPDFLAGMLKGCKEEGFHTCVDTCGYAERSCFEKALSHTDLFLYDLKLMDDSIHLKFTGVSNRLILDNLEWLSEKSCNLVIRIPLIPGITDTDKNLLGIAEFLSGTRFREIELVPYHNIARGKYIKLNLPHHEFTEKGQPVEEVIRFFREKGFETRIS